MNKIANLCSDFLYHLKNSNEFLILKEHSNVSISDACRKDIHYSCRFNKLSQQKTYIQLFAIAALVMELLAGLNCYKFCKLEN